jgi:DNA-binding NarL/FixJ family response regulator
VTVRVLIADDDDAFRRALADLLTAFGHVDVVGSARDGREAVELFSALGPDVVFMDVVMPVCDGIEATRRILARDPDARIVALTAGDDHRALALCLAAGAKGCLKKAPDTITLAPLMLALAGARRRAGAMPAVSPKRPRDEPGKTAQLKVRLEAGRYVLLCNLSGHYAGGMRVALRVT